MEEDIWDLSNRLEKDGTDFEYEEGLNSCHFIFPEEVEREYVSRLALEHGGDFHRKEEVSTGELIEYGISFHSSEPLELSEDREERTSYA